MALTPIDAFCINCGVKFNQAPKQSFLGFQKLACPACQAESIYPLSVGYRLAYWSVFASLVLLIINAISRYFTVSAIGWLCIGGVFLILVSDKLLNYRLSQAQKFFADLEKLQHEEEEANSASKAQPHYHELQQDPNDAEFEHEIYRIIEEYQQGLMAKAIREAQGNKDMIQDIYVQFRHHELTSKLEEQCNRNIERKLRKQAKKPQQLLDKHSWHWQDNWFMQLIGRYQKILDILAIIGVVILTVMSISKKPSTVTLVPNPVVKLNPAASALPTATEIAAQYRKEAEQGNVIAQYKLGLFYQEGKGVEKNDTEALRWLRKAAQGHADAQLSLAHSYKNGRGVNKDETQALLWYRRAAEQNQAEAQLILGDMYAQGRGGLTKDEIQAVAWYQKAASQGNAAAQVLMGEAYSRGLGGLSEDDVQAVAWYQKAAEQGNPEGQNRLGSMYEVGRGVAKDEKQAVAWYRKAADQGHAEGQNNLAAMYFYGRGVAKDEAQAITWYQEAAKKGLAEAQFNLGNLYLEGKGVPKDTAQAAAWYFKAAEQGDEDAKEALRELTED